MSTNNDPRVGSARDNSTSPGLSRLIAGSNSSSGRNLLATIVPVLIWASICCITFWVLRRKCPRVYAPRSFLKSLEPHERSAPLSKGWFNWFNDFYFIPSTFVLNHSSLDGYLFLRFLRVLGVICLVGVALLWPILLPLHVTGGAGNHELDALTMGNIVDSRKLYAHVVLAWVYFLFILTMVSRECIYYINLRQAYLLSPYYANRLSSRTVLYMNVPKQYLDEARLRWMLGDSVKRIWIPQTTSDLERLVKEREQTAMRLEKAEFKLIKLATLARTKALKNAANENDKTSRPPSVSDRESKPASTDSTLKSGAVQAVQNVDRESKTASTDSTLKSETAQAVQISDDAEPEISLASTLKVGDARSVRTPDESEPPGISRDATMKSDTTQAVQLSDKSEIVPYDTEETEGPPLPDVNGAVASQWISHSSRPVHRPLANYGRRVDTIKWTRNQIKKLNNQIARIRHDQLFKTEGMLPSVFVEFETHTDAQNAYQTLTHHRPLYMAQRYIGVRPFEIMWTTLTMSWFETIARGFLIKAFITVLIVFWAIPCALAGTISNIEYLSQKVPFLGWIEKLPSAILGIISGFLPALALSLLMSIVPGILRYCARVGGVPTLSLIELYVQHAYFAFQVVQVFLVTTLTSAASAAITKLLEDPTSAEDLLAQNLPKASNFYLSYFFIQSMGLGAGHLVQWSNLLQFHILQRFSNNPRKTYLRWHRLQRIHWGGVFPVYTNLGVIALTYALIAPMVLGFAVVGLAFLHTVYRYNLVYVYDSEIDTKGLVYPRALMQLLLGLYFSEILMIGLFALKGAFIPLVLMIGLLVVTGLVHTSLIDALGPLLWSLPKSLTKEEDQHLLARHPTSGYAVNTHDAEQFAQPSDFMEEGIEHEVGGSRGLEGAGGASNALGGGIKKVFSRKLKQQAPEVIVGLDALAGFWRRWLSPDPGQKSNWLLAWLHPEVFSDYTVLRKMVPTDLPDPTYPEDVERDIYYAPSFMMKPPTLWIPKDPGGVSRQEVEHCEKAIPATDQYVTIDEKGGLKIDLDEPRLVFDIDRLRY